MSNNRHNFDVLARDVMPDTQRDVIRNLLEFVMSSHAAQRVTCDLVDRFGTVASITAASPTELQTVANTPAKTLAILGAARQIGVVIALEPLLEKLIISDRFSLYEYFRQMHAGEPREIARVLLLDGACRLIADEKHAVGTNDFVPIVVREVARVALQWNAAAVIMTHNHPYNTKQASKQDKMQIKDLGSRLRGIGIALVDSIIITDKECISMRSGAEIDNLNVDDYGIRAILDSTAWFDAY